MTRGLILTLLMTAGFVGITAWPADAHHSFAATYRQGETVTIEGEVVQVLLRNPHSFVEVQVKQPNGSRVRYIAEWQGADRLDSEGVTMHTLRPGDRVVIAGAPSRDTAGHRILMTGLYRPRDKFSWGEQPGQAIN